MSLRGVVANLIMRFFSVIPLQDKIVFSCFYGNTYGDNPEVIFREFKNRFHKIKYIWLLENNSLQIDGAVVVNVNSIKALYHLSTAKLWIDNSRKKDWVYKRRNQFYVQTWHGDVCLKKIEKDALDSIDTTYIRYAKHDSKMADLMLSGSDFRTTLYKNSFWYSGKILELGTPKSVVFYEDPNPYIEKVKQFYSVRSNANIVLYCPTFRSTDDLNLYNIEYDRLIKNLEEKFGGKWVAFVRLHPKINKLQDQIKYSDTVINASNYVSVDELIIASQLVITDYSGCMFAGLEANKPVVLYAVDIEDYIRNDRGFYFDLNNLPFPLAQNNDELEKVIKEFDLGQYVIESTQFKKKLGFKTDTYSTKKIVDYLISQVWEENIQ